LATAIASENGIGVCVQFTVAVVIDAGTPEIATGIGGVPERITPTVGRAVRGAIEESSGLGQGLDLHVAFL
jgi:hypothetical protein